MANKENAMLESPTGTGKVTIFLFLLLIDSFSTLCSSCYDEF